MVDPEISRFPHKELPHMPGSQTTPGRPGDLLKAVGGLSSVAARRLGES